MRKQFFFYLALIWTGVILFMSLEDANDFRKINIENFDKVIHVGFHFIFTTLWFLYFKKRIMYNTIFQPLSFALIGSFVFGVAIEFMQEYFTTTRSADVYDVYADLFGAALAVFSIVVLDRRSKLIDKI